jgi:MFS family permease
MTTVAGADAPAVRLSQRARLEILGAILLALFLFALDQTVVGTALPVIITDLHGDALYTWSVTVYLLTATISGPIYGKLSDLFGRRPIFIWAVSLFLVSSVFAGLSQEMWQFILFRGIQGLGGGAVFPVALAVVADLYTPAERGKYLGCSARCSGCPRCLARASVGSSPTTSGGTGSSSSMCRSP